MFAEYDMIYEELCDRVENGELTIEEAEMINEAAYDRYVTEFESDVKRYYDDRRTQEKLSHNHIPKDRRMEISQKPLNSRPSEKYDMHDYRWNNFHNKSKMNINKWLIEKDKADIEDAKNWYKIRQEEEKRMQKEKESLERLMELNKKLKKLGIKK